ncbi:MAG: Clp protease N-terminal domain-containing protein [Dehalococcoidia bacterium]
MQDRFDRLSPAARQALEQAQALADRHGAAAVGTDHLLLGVIRLGDPTISLVLAELGASADSVEEAIVVAQQPASSSPNAPFRTVLQSGPQIADDDSATGLPDMALTPRLRRIFRSSRASNRLKQAFAFAEDDARARGLGEIGPEHLLVAAIRDPAGAAARIVRPLGVDYEGVRRVLRTGPAERPPTRSEPARTDTVRATRKSTPPVFGPAPVEAGLSLPADLLVELQALANRRSTTVEQIVIQFVKLGLLALAVQDKPDGAVLLREGARERQIVLI